MKKKQTQCTTAHFLAVMDCLTAEAIESLKTAERPDTMDGNPLKHDINGIMYGELIELMSIKTVAEEFVKPMQVVEGMSEADVLKADIKVTAGYRNWAVKELDRVQKLFEELGKNIRYTPQEIQAGVEGLSFGAFGVVDSYARRMGIVNHDYVLECVPWIVIYQCMKMDNETVAYQRRLQEIIYKRK